MDSKRKNLILLVIGILAVLLLIYIKVNYKPSTSEPSVPLSGETTTFEKGKSYNLDFRTENLAGFRSTYCYETQYHWVFTDEMGEENPCTGLEGRNKLLVSKINMQVRLKEKTTQDMFNILNIEHGVTVLAGTNSDNIIPLEIPYHVGYEYNSYTLAQKYFDTGYFEFVRPTTTVGMGEEY